MIDPGPLSTQHLDAIVAAIGPRSVASVLVTHSHSDHAPLANPLGKRTGRAGLRTFALAPTSIPTCDLSEGSMTRRGRYRPSRSSTPRAIATTISVS